MRRRYASLLATVFFVSPVWAGELAAVLRETQTHPALAAASSRVVAAEAQVSAETRRYLGSGGVMAEAARYEDQRFVGVLSPQAFARPPFARDLMTYGVSYSVPVDWTGAIGAARQAGEFDLAAARLAERQVALMKLHAATSAYVRLQALLSQREVLAVQRERVGQTVERVQAQVQTEQASTADLRLAQAELARLRSDEVRLDGQVATQRAALEEAVGRRLLPAANVIDIPQWIDEPVGDLLPIALAGAQADSAAAKVQVLRRSLWPALAARGEYLQFDSDSEDPDAWSVSAQVTVPIDPASWKRVDVARAQAEAAMHARQAARRQVQEDWTALQSAYESARADAEALSAETTARREVVDVQAELQRVGLVSLEDFLRQQRDLLESEARLTQARAGAAVAWSAAQVLRGVAVETYIAGLDGASMSP
ncbi:MAG: TolC family protein [Pseudomonadota bacterium]|nr:TolC family protein [Pseudomonadota bacterium]